MYCAVLWHKSGPKQGFLIGGVGGGGGGGGGGGLHGGQVYYICMNNHARLGGTGSMLPQEILRN